MLHPEVPFMSSAANPVVKIAPNNRVFALPVIVAIEEGLFEKAGLDVSFWATYADGEKDRAEKPVLSRLKEELFECGSADSYNVCEWASIDRLERGKRGGKVAALRAAIAAQAILTFDDELQTPRDMFDRSEEHTSELQSRLHLVCRLLLEKKKTKQPNTDTISQ